MPQDNLKTFEKTKAFAREQVSLFGNLDRKSRYSGTAAQKKKKANLSEKIAQNIAATIAGRKTY